ncbi:MAG: D-alanine--D-alanine ligase [Gemmatimonadota bacterium]
MTSRRRIRVGILFGGESAEHEVALQSAANIVEAIDSDRYEVILIGVDPAGRWHLSDARRYLSDAMDPKRIRLSGSARDVTLVPGRGSRLQPVGEGAEEHPLDVVFPVLHGPLGEDGCVQGLLRLAHLPFVGAGVLGSAIGMDKDVSKRLLRDAGIPIARFRAFHREFGSPPAFDDLASDLGLPFFVKPANMGSSVGVTKVRTREGFDGAIRRAFDYDRKLVVEEFIEGREIECAVLGNAQPSASVPGEVIARHDFYSYEAKYLDEEGAELRIPAELPDETVQRIRDLAIETFRVLCCEGMARVDFFVTTDGEVRVNELNSIPGFTRISMYPKLWEASGVGYPELIDRLLELAVERARNEEALNSSVRL